MKTIYLLCLHNVRTGGPEAIHQLSDSLLKQGFDARMVYYNRGHIARLEGGPIDEEGYHFSDAPEYMRCQFDEYAHYATRIESAVPNSTDAIVVLPEVICHLTPKFNKATVLVWWLSVDNAFGALSRVNLNHLRHEPKVRHAAQSDYAKAFVETLKLNHNFPVDKLTDYTPLESGPLLQWYERPRLVAINANEHKVIYSPDALAAAIQAIDPEIMIEKIQGGVDTDALFKRARLYVDCGNFPGRDRMPREASRRYCQVLMLAAGAATYPDMEMWHPTRWHVWSDVGLKRLAEEVVECVKMADEKIPLGMGSSPHNYERTQFDAEVVSLFRVL